MKISTKLVLIVVVLVLVLVPKDSASRAPEKRGVERYWIKAIKSVIIA